MSAPANDILTAVKTLVEAAFPGQTCHVRRASDKNPELWADCEPPCWTVNANADRPTEMLYARVRQVVYVLELTHLTPELPGDRAASPGVESALDAAGRLFAAARRGDGKPGLQGAETVSRCRVRPLAPYKMPFKVQTVNASRLRLEVESVEPAI